MHLITELRQKDLIKTGDFTLKSGLKSNLYFDFKSLISYPKLVSDLSFELSKLIVDNDCCIAGVPIGGIPYAVSISYITNLPMILIRDEKKTYGTCNQIEGNTFNKQIILIEDVITTGMSVINTIEILKVNNIHVKQIICILDRESGGVDKLLNLNYNVKSLYKLNDLINYNPSLISIKNTNLITNKLLDIINTKKSNLIVSLDITNENELLTKLDLIGDFICAVKIHYDIITDLSTEFHNKISILKLDKNFLIIEDRKFADIPYISLKQLNYISSFADIVTVHGICGNQLLNEFKNIGILLIHQLSIEGNLIDTIYSNKVKEFAKNHDNIVGFVSQTKVLEDYLTFTPGINLDSIKTDNKGQIYKSIKETNSDIFIVGRAIYESDDIVKITKYYQTEAFNKWKYY